MLEADRVKPLGSKHALRRLRGTYGRQPHPYRHTRAERTLAQSCNDYVEARGLMSYGPDYPDLFRKNAEMVDKILRGTKAGDIPVEQPTKFEFAINAKTDAPTTGIFRWKVSASTRAPVGTIAGAKNGRGYRQIRIDGRPYSASRLAWLYMIRKWPNSEISYFNGKPSDTRWANLREATSSPNRNRSKRK